MQKKKFKVGDKIVEFGQVFRIYKIEKIRDSNGELERAIFFRHYYQRRNIATLVCSIPIKNVEKTKMRKPISQKEFRLLIKKLKKKRKIEKNRSIYVAFK